MTMTTDVPDAELARAAVYLRPADAMCRPLPTAAAVWAAIASLTSADDGMREAVERLLRAAGHR